MYQDEKPLLEGGLETGWTNVVRSGFLGEDGRSTIGDVGLPARRNGATPYAYHHIFGGGKTFPTGQFHYPVVGIAMRISPAGIVGDDARTKSRRGECDLLVPFAPARGGRHYHVVSVQ